MGSDAVMAYIFSEFALTGYNWAKKEVEALIFSLAKRAMGIVEGWCVLKQAY
ncbi:hypothetical protein ACTXJJ_11810 [Corynebacterium casei]|uniref:hypothetical protein n=1 Tax=Corynebacterium casei TaxID=160386 RepID=UPI003FCFF3BE